MYLSPEGAETEINWDRQVSGRTSDSQRKDLSRATIAFHAAKTVYQFVEDEHGLKGSLTLANGAVLTYKDLILLELVLVSANSYQIILAYLSDPPV